MKVLRNSSDIERLQHLVRAFRGRRLLVLADLVADEFVYGRVQRISREAPVLILEHEGSAIRPGGGANAVHNIKSLGERLCPSGSSVATITAGASPRSSLPRESPPPVW